MKDIRKLTLTAMFLAILILLAITPLGFIPIGPINATTMHIPVIIGSLVLGPRLGAFLGGSFGVISMIRNTTIITPLSFVFSPFIPIPGLEHGSWKAIIISIIPRILIGVAPYYIYKGLKKLFKGKATALELFIAGVGGSLVNTILVMNLIYFLFKQPYAEIIGASGSAIYGAVMGVIFTSGIPEAIVAGLITAPITMILLKMKK